MNAAGYFRISQDDSDGRKQSPEGYRRVIQEHCVRHGYELVEIWEDTRQAVGHDVSGGTAHLERPAWRAMWERRSEFAVVVVPDLERFGRSDHNKTTRALMGREGIALEYCNLTVDDTAEGELTEDQFDSLAKYQRGKAASTWRRELETLAHNGRVTGGAVTSYGFLYDATDGRNKNIRPDYEPMPLTNGGGMVVPVDIVRWIYTMYAEGKSARWIAQDLSARGIPNRRRMLVRDRNTGEIQEKDSRSDAAGTWWTPNITRILDNPTYAPHPDNPERGILRRHVWVGRFKDGRNPRQRTKEFVDYVGAWEPLIDRETWEAVRERRDSKQLQMVAIDVDTKTGKQHRVGVGGNTGNGTYLLSGLIVCSECGRNLNHQPKKTRRPAMYSCVPAAKGSMRTVCHCGGVSEGRADKEVSGRFLEMVEPARLRGIMDNLSHERRNGAEYDRELASIDRRMEQLVMQLADAGTGQARAVQSAIGKLEDKHVKVEAARDSAKEAVEQQSSEARDVSGLIELLHKHTPGLAETEWTTDVLEEVWYSLTIERRRHLLSRAIERVELVPGEVGFMVDKNGRERRYNKTPKTLRIVFKDWVREAV